jgi:hypothetical protein
MSLNDFTDAYPKNKKYEDNQGAIIALRIIRNNAEAMEDASAKGEPAVSAVAAELESLREPLATHGFDLEDQYTRTVVAQMICFILESRGFEVDCIQRDIPKEYGAKLFKSGATYRRLA